VDFLMAAHRMSCRRACKVARVQRSTKQYCPRPDRNAALRARLKELAAQNTRYGSHQLWLMLKKEVTHLGYNRVERIYRKEGLSLRLKRKRKKLRHLREALPVPDRRDEVWAMDFVHDELVDFRRFKALTIIDHCTRESPAIYASRSIRGSDVARVLERLKIAGRKPKMIVSDNGPEFVSRAMARWAQLNDVKLFFIEPGKPTQNAFIESFNGKFRDLCLNQNWFSTIEEARLIIEAWRQNYEEVRPHSSLGGLTPKEFASKNRDELNGKSFRTMSL
jgi:putative transposase